MTCGRSSHGRSPGPTHCRRAQLAAIVRSSGSLHLESGGRRHLEIELPAGLVARRLVELLRAASISYELRRVRGRRYRGGHERLLVVAAIDSANEDAVRQIGLVDESGRHLPETPPEIFRRACCRHAYLRGCFLAAGSVAGPGRPAQLELRTHSLDAARGLVGLAAKDDVRLRARERRDHAVAYCQRARDIEEFLALLGAGESTLTLAEAEVAREVRGGANRHANAETANIRRQVDAAYRQLQAIAVLRRTGAIGGLPAALVEAAELREAYPDLSLAELSEMAVPPLPRPTLAARLRRLETAAASWR